MVSVKGFNSLSFMSVFKTRSLINLKIVYYLLRNHVFEIIERTPFSPLDKGVIRIYYPKKISSPLFSKRSESPLTAIIQAKIVYTILIMRNRTSCLL